MLSGKGFSKIYNLSGGIKAWEKEVAIGSEDTGLHLFSGEASAEEVIVTGFGLEMGLRDFYLSMESKVSSEEARSLFGKLAAIELNHEARLVDLYKQVTGNELTLEEFAQKIAAPSMEGGLTTEDYLERYKIDQESELEILSLAMAIEAQALDLYSRAAENSKDDATRRVLQQIAADERSHIARLANYIDEPEAMT
ncbi:MAG: rubrerythrin [Desulforhopalus sp.]|jgi:rubrerythrin